MMIETCCHRIGYRRVCQDAIGVFELQDRVVIVVADGAGGIEDGEVASRSVVESVRQAAVGSEIDWTLVLRQADFSVSSGQSTACVVEISEQSLRGASIGDSRIGIVMGDELIFPTDGQSRKPLLGSGQAQPRGFTFSWNGGLVIVASDGLWNQVRDEQILAQSRLIDFPVLASRLCALARLPSGTLADDVAVVCARHRIVHPPRQRIDLTLDT